MNITDWHYRLAIAAHFDLMSVAATPRYQEDIETPHARTWGRNTLAAAFWCKFFPLSEWSI